MKKEHLILFFGTSFFGLFVGTLISLILVLLFNSGTYLFNDISSAENFSIFSCLSLLFFLIILSLKNTKEKKISKEEYKGFAKFSILGIAISFSACLIPAITYINNYYITCFIILYISIILIKAVLAIKKI